MASLPSAFPWNLGGDPDAETTATSADETARLAEYLKGKPNVEALLDNLGEPAAVLAGVLNDMVELRYLANATGAQLDLYGSIVGQVRAGLSDAEYYRRIRARVLLNRCSGSVEEIYAIMALVLPAGSAFTLEDAFPAGFNLRYTSGELTAAEADSVLRFLYAARAAGVRGLLYWRTADPTEVFTFNGTTAQALNNGHFSGAALKPGTS